MELHFEQSDTEFYTPFAGLAFVGRALNKKTSLKKSLRKIKKRHGISNIDLVRAYYWIFLYLIQSMSGRPDNFYSPDSEL